ncbi:MAG: polysaccharide deacetylase family protein [Clostridia bacterium]|nr:polysaccharide deacetylase family protein [Clostridia bacterium]
MNTRLKKKISALSVALVLAVSQLCACTSSENATIGMGRDEVTDTESVMGIPEGTDSTPTSGEGTPPIEHGGYASYSGSEAEGNLTYITHTGKVLTDFSKFDSLGRDFFSDTSDKTNGSWYCGVTVRDEVTGKVTVKYDRAPDVFEALEEYGSIYRKNEDEKVIYITFDCGYEDENGYTDEVLDVLREKGVKASFFLNGAFIKEAPQLVRRMIDEGHIVGNHGNNHKVMSRLSLEEFFYEIESNNELLREAVPGAPYMKYFRPSYGSCSPWDMAMYREMDLVNVLYSWAYYDYDPNDQLSPEEALAKMKSGLHNGSVLMLHTVGETNALVLGDFIDYVRSEGYEIRNIDE